MKSAKLLLSRAHGRVCICASTDCTTMLTLVHVDRSVGVSVTVDVDVAGLSPAAGTRNDSAAIAAEIELT